MAGSNDMKSRCERSGHVFVNILQQVLAVARTCICKYGIKYRTCTEKLFRIPRLNIDMNQVRKFGWCHSNLNTSLIASATQDFIRSSYKSAEQCISGASAQYSNVKSAYSQHLPQQQIGMNCLQNNGCPDKYDAKIRIPSMEDCTVLQILCSCPQIRQSQAQL